MRDPSDRTQQQSLYERLRDGILEAELTPGQSMVETSLAQRFGVSRTPVREALLRLEQDGLVERADRGYIVRQRSPEQILDIYETRIVLEVMAARLAAERHTTLDRIRLERLSREGAGVDPADAGALVVHNREFHQGVWIASHNEALVDLLTRLNHHLVRYPATTLSFPGRWAVALSEHAALVEAIVNRDSDVAAKVAETHFTSARDIRLELWAQDIY